MEVKPKLVKCHMATLSEQQGFFYMHHPTDRIIHTPVLEQWLEVTTYAYPINTGLFFNYDTIIAIYLKQINLMEIF